MKSQIRKPTILAKGTIVCANNRVFAGCNTVRQLANLADIPAQYVHPATKQCNYSVDTSSFLQIETTSQSMSYSSSAQYRSLREVYFDIFNLQYGMYELQFSNVNITEWHSSSFDMGGYYLHLGVVLRYTGSNSIVIDKTQILLDNTSAWPANAPRSIQLNTTVSRSDFASSISANTSWPITVSITVRTNDYIDLGTVSVSSSGTCTVRKIW